jgi:hypothetical protein
MSGSLLYAVSTGKVAAIIYGDLIKAYRNNNVDGFDRIIQEYNQYLAGTVPEQLSRTRLEFFFNQAQPFLLELASKARACELCYRAGKVVCASNQSRRDHS